MFYESKKDLFMCWEHETYVEFPLHLHAYIEYIHVVHGTIQMQIAQKKYNISSGQIALVFPNVPHSYHTITNPYNTSFKIFNCYLELLPFLEHSLTDTHPMYPVIDADSLQPDIEFVENRLFSLNPQKDSSALISSLSMFILCMVLQHMELLPNSKTKIAQLPGQVIEYISEHYLEDISLNSISHTLGVSKYKVSRIMNEIVGIKFYYYIDSLRLDYAKNLLRKTDKAITMIAMDSGFQNQQTFNRVFKTEYHCTPKEYRKFTKPSNSDDDLSSIQREFLHLIPKSGTILNLEFDSEHTTLCFQNAGYSVTPVNFAYTSPESVENAMTFANAYSRLISCQLDKTFDGIWAFDILPINNLEQTLEIIRHFENNLKKGGYFYISFLEKAKNDDSRKKASQTNGERLCNAVSKGMHLSVKQIGIVDGRTGIYLTK